jgi:hypothetical protein
LNWLAKILEKGKTMSDRLSKGTRIRICGFYKELENYRGVVVGYADDNPIVQIETFVSKEYPYTVLIVPARYICVETESAQTDEAKPLYRLIRCGVTADGRKLYRYVLNCDKKEQCQSHYQNCSCMYEQFLAQSFCEDVLEEIYSTVFVKS